MKIKLNEKIFTHLKLAIASLIIFILGFGAKAYIINNLGDMDLTGPDPYLFYRYTQDLYIKGYIEDPDCYRYIPICGGIDKILLPYIAVYNIKLLDNFYIYYSLINRLLNLYNISPKVSNTFDFGIHTTVPLLFGMSSVVFFLLSYTLFKRKILYSLLSTLLFITTPILTYRISIFEKEAVATPFIILAFLLYYLGISNENIRKRVVLYSLSGLSMILSFLGWGGWIIAPLAIGLSHFIYSIKSENRDYSFLIYIIPIIVIGYLQYGLDKLTNIFMSTSTISMILPMNIIILDYIFDKLRLFQKLDGVSTKISKILYINKTIAKRIIIIILLFLIFSPIILYKFKFIYSNPWSERFASSVAEQQPSTPDQYKSLLKDLGILMVFVFLTFSLYRNDKTLYKTLSVINPLLFIYIVIFSDIHVLYSWIAFAIILVHYIIAKYSIDPRETLIFSMLTITMVIGDYINRTLFFLGYSIPLVYAYNIMKIPEIVMGIMNKTRIELILKIKNNYIDIIIAFLLILTSASGIYLYINVEKLFVYLIPSIVTLYFVYDVYIKQRSERMLENWLQISIILLVLYGISFINIFGEIISYTATRGIYGTEKYLIDAMRWVKYNTEQDALISFWWDYGYYAQTIGNRTTWLDGGNNYIYWNHLMGRYGLSMDEESAIKLLYVHATYNWNTFLVLELFDKNQIFWDKNLYKKLNITDEEASRLLVYKSSLGDSWKYFIEDLLTKNNTLEVFDKYKVPKEIKYILNKLQRAEYRRPIYYMIHPTDIGKSYQFTKIGSDEVYDLHTWISLMYSAIIVDYRDVKRFSGLPSVVRSLGNGLYIITFAQDNKLIYYGDIPLDSEMLINNTKIPRCYPELEILNCGRVVNIIIEFSDDIVKTIGAQNVIEYDKISPDNIKNATIIITYNNKIFEMPLKCVFVNNRKLLINDYGYGGCLYITPSANLGQLPEGKFMSGYFISEKAMDMLWVQLYFFEESEKFEKVFDSHEYYGYQSTILSEMSISPLKIWKVNIPEEYKVDRYITCLYLATNIREINKCNKLFNKPPVNSIWEV